jgi:outer membrane protein TolC
MLVAAERDVADADSVAEPTPRELPTGEPYALNVESIIHMIYEMSPAVAASREEDIAAQHQLEEFKANLSRFEPFAEFNTTGSAFPKRRDSDGLTGELLAGLEKDMFDGAQVRVEGGVSASRVEFGETGEGQDDVETGSGALMRARLEVPFVGSRLRQNRVISQAFQESTARKAALDYLGKYRAASINGLTFYWDAILWRNYIRAYDSQLDALEALHDDPRVDEADRARVWSTATHMKVLRDRFAASYSQELTSLLATLGIEQDAAFVLEEPPEGVYLERGRSREGVLDLLAEAYENNPAFLVLDDAIRNARLQREQAIAGTLDITLFVEGTQFPFGAETFDDRVGGWEIRGGVRVRLNDLRVLRASRLKAEAQIRQFEAQIEQERREIEREIVSEVERLRSNEELGRNIREEIDKKRAEFDQRARAFLAGADEALTIDDVLLPLQEKRSAEIELQSTAWRSRRADVRLMAATGEIYRRVDMDIGNGNKTETDRSVLDDR